MNVENKLKEMGIVLPEQSAPKAMYIPVRQAGNLLFISGQLPTKDGVLVTGKVGKDRTLEEAQEAAKLCAINILAAAKAYLGDLDKIDYMVKLQAFVSSETGFDSQHLVTNGASQLFFDALGDAGLHARTAVAVNQLPLDATIEIEAIIAIKE